jgi:serine/threonine-protein kinase
MPPPPRPASSRSGGAASAGGTPSSASGLRSKEAEKQPGTFFLGRYRVVDEIGVGGMASVHLARMDGPGGFQKWVAIKRIHPHLVEDDQFVDMFLDEARIAAGINHANVAQVFDLGKDDNTYWIAMEYLHGEPLREVMRRAEERRMRIMPDLAARICADAADGLHAAHELRGKNGQLLGLVHRDVTPHNLFLTYEGYTKVVDFGIAKVADRLSSTRAGTLKGKLAYMSPEQVRGAEVDRTTDIFALGVVLWELTTNQRLFRMDTDLDTLEKVQACIVPPPSTIIPGYPPELEACVMKALSKRKQDRYATAREFSRALQSFLMRSGSFCGPEEVGIFIRQVFADRIQKREAHLAWAAEVTSTINVDQLRALGKMPGGEDASLNGDEPDDPRARSGGSAAMGPPVSMGGMQPPSSGARPVAAPPATAQMAAMSLMDDDEDVPTTVAMREQMELVAARGPRPAAGMPAPQAPQGGYGAPPPQQQPQPQPQQQARPAYGAAPQQQPSSQQFNQSSPQGYAQAPRQQGQYGQPNQAPPDHGQGGLSADDLGQTVALPMPSGPEPDRPRPAGGQPYGGQYGPGQGGNNGQQGQASNQSPPAQNQGYAAPPQQQPQHYGYAQQQAPAPHYGPQGAQNQQYGGHLPPLPPQSTIETALSLPRPDPAALWLAQQEKQRGDRRNSGVLIAVVALTALCVIGIGALVYFKLHNAPPKQGGTESQPSTAASEVASAAAPTATADATAAPVATVAPTATATAVASVAPTAAPVAPVAPASTGGNTAGATAAAAAAAKDKPGKEDPGFLTIVCNPYCDDVLDQGRSLGPSPIVHLSVKPGQHRITLKKGTSTKVISVIVESGQVAAQRVSMK